MIEVRSPLRRNLKTLVSKRFSLLEQRLKHSTRRSNPYQSIISEALLEEIRKVVLSKLEEILSSSDIKPAPAEGVPEDPGAAPACQCRCCTQGGAGGQGACMPPWYPGNDGCFGGAQMEITLDQMVAQTLMHGRQTSGVLRSLFGLVPLLIGR